jgi:hypothetical protein
LNEFVALLNSHKVEYLVVGGSICSPQSPG